MSSLTHSPHAESARAAPATVAAALRRWLFSGSCQEGDGAYCAWRDAESGALAFAYPEINGYLLTFAAGLPDLAAAEASAARRSADWITARLGRRDLSARPGWDGGAVYTFDLAMIAAGLLSFGRRFGGDFVDAGLALVAYLAGEIEAAGRLPAVARGPQATHTGWSTEGRAHLLKGVQCLLLAEEFGHSGTRPQARALIAEAAGLQRPDGRFVTDLGDVATMLHPHHYALEGLWVWGRATSEEWALERARRGGEWVFAHQLPSGGFPRFVTTSTGEPGPEQADVTAQAVRIAHLLELEPAGLGRAVGRLIELTVGDDRERAVLYQPAAERRHENVWATLFAGQALRLAEGSRELPWDVLV